MEKSVEVASRDRHEDRRQNARQNNGTHDCLHCDRVLDLSKRRLLNPCLLIEDLSEKVTLVVLLHPGLQIMTLDASKLSQIFPKHTSSS
jgi:hypothetical protein